MSSLKQLTEEGRRVVIGEFYRINWHKGKTYTARHFLAMGVPKSTLYAVMRKCDEGIPLARKTGSGRPRVKMPSDRVHVLKKYMTEKIGRSQSRAAEKFKISQQYVSKILRQKTPLKYRLRQKVSGVTEEQKLKQKKRCRKLRDGALKPGKNTVIVMDDESYFPFDCSEVQANKGFYTENKENADPNVRYVRKEKFPKKVMVWVAISASGVSRCFMAYQSAMNGATYRKECLPRLKEFIERYHSADDVIFWPDLATAHYEKSVREELKRLKIPVVARAENPPAVPQLRPIEKFWAQLKAKVYEGGWKAENDTQLRARITHKISHFTPGECQRLMAHVKTNVRRVADHGHSELLRL